MDAGVISAIIAAAATIGAALIGLRAVRSHREKPKTNEHQTYSDSARPPERIKDPLASQVTLDDLELLFASTLGVPDDYDFSDRPLSNEVAQLQQEIDNRLDEYAQEKIVAHLANFQADAADSPRTRMDEELDELIRETKKEGREHEIRRDLNIGGNWQTYASHVGEGKVTTYAILQDQNGVRITQKHPQIGLTLSGRGLITPFEVRLWYRTINGVTGELQLELPDLIVIGEPFDLKGRWDSGHGRYGRIALTRP